jgi:hypothetical protein
MNIYTLKNIAIWTVLIILFTACNSNQPISIDHFIPAKLDDDWDITTRQEHGFDESVLLQMMQQIEDEKFTGISSILIAHQGKLVFEAYPGSFKRDDIHSTRSAGKSITAAFSWYRD